jgi:hypothetical protein
VRSKPSSNKNKSQRNILNLHDQQKLKPHFSVTMIALTVLLLLASYSASYLALRHRSYSYDLASGQPPKLAIIYFARADDTFQVIFWPLIRFEAWLLS